MLKTAHKSSLTVKNGSQLSQMQNSFIRSPWSDSPKGKKLTKPFTHRLAKGVGATTQCAFSRPIFCNKNSNLDISSIRFTVGKQVVLRFNITAKLVAVRPVGKLP
jgi:hypothetical protein